VFWHAATAKEEAKNDHKLTNFGTLKLEGFGPEATKTAPVSVR